MPMNPHPVTHVDVMAYLDGELSPEAAAEMTAHLTQCRACQDVAADLQGVSRQISGWAVEVSESSNALPANLASALASRAAGKTKRPTSVWSWRFLTQHPWFAAAAALIVLIAGILLTRAERRALKTEAALISQSDQVFSNNATAVTPPIASFNAAPTELSAPPKAVALPSAETPPLVVRTADLRLSAHNFETVRVDLDRILLQFNGHIAQLNTASPTGEARSLTATLRIPSSRLEAALGELRKLGRVDGESQRGEEVTQQSIDLEARLNNARHTEERLTEILRTRTGKLSDVLEVEEKLSQVRGEIEQAEAEQKSLNNRVSFATVSLQVSEDYRAPLAGTTPSVGTRLSNAAVDGLHTAFNGFIGLIQTILAAGPSVLLWSLLLGSPAYLLWKKLRHR